MAKRMVLRGKVAVVTGAGSGIGRALADSLAGRGCRLALIDIREEGLRETVELLPSGVVASRYVADVSDPDAVAELPARVLADHQGVDLLINNAGVALGGTFEKIDPVDFDWLFSINFLGVVRMTRAFLPLLKERPEALIVNMSSVFGLVAPPGQTAYSASKFAVRGFSESLRHELQETGVRVCVVHPGGVATSIADNARVPKDADEEAVGERRESLRSFLKMPPAEAAEAIVRGIEARRPRVVVGRDARFAALLERLFPTSHWNLIQRAVMK